MSLVAGKTFDSLNCEGVSQVELHTRPGRTATAFPAAAHAGHMESRDDAGPVADLHVHTTVSDGTLTLAELPAAAREAGLECVAVTDHDRLNPDLSDPVTTRDGVVVVHGIELRVTTDVQRVDLLGLGVRRTDALTDLIDRLQRDRVARAAAIVDCVERELGVSLPLELEPGVGRPHVARAIQRSPAPMGYQEAFDRLIGDDGPCYVARDIPTVDEGLRVLRSAARVVGLAHPFRYHDPERALELAPRLDGVERYYPYDRVDPGRDDLASLDRLLETRDLLALGGSDAHERQLGVAGLDCEAYAPVAAALDA
jgi:hypothetical protein